MITEAEVWALVNALPPESFVRRFCEYGHFVCDAPMAFFLGSALSVLATTAPDHVELQFGAPTIPSLWCLLLGDSGSRKTTAARLAVQLLQAMSPEQVGNSHESEASLLEALGMQPRQLIFHGEFGAFLGGTQKGSYKQSIRERYMDLWDGTRATKARVNGTIVIDKPRLSLLCCVAPSLIEKYTDEEAWTGGFFNRFLVLAGDRERKHMPPPSWPEMKDFLIELLQYRNGLPVGPVTPLEGEALLMLQKWDAVMEKKYAGDAQRWTVGVHSRLPIMAVKCAMVYSMDCGAGAKSNGEPWSIDPASMQAGILTANMHMQSVTWVIETLALSPYARERRILIDAMGDDIQQSLGQILRRCNPKMPKRRVLEVLESLEAEGVCRKFFATSGAGEVWSTGKAPVTAVSDAGHVGW